jgi:predicted TPR repeat methyltransferase
VDARQFVPAAAAYGTTIGAVVRCVSCGHGSLRETPTPEAVAAAYAGAVDEDSIREEAGQVATARRDLVLVRDALDEAPGRLVDIGCWTGSLVVAATELGWQARGVEPSAWAAHRAAERGVDVTQASLGAGDGLEEPVHQVVSACDVLEHLLDPAAAVTRMAGGLQPGGALLLTVPDAGSRTARALGRRWWSVLPMHVQYFTRRSMAVLLEGAGLEVRTMATHPKLFSRRYYAERLESFLPGAGPAVRRAVHRSARGGSLIGPDLRDRLLVVAGKPPAHR